MTQLAGFGVTLTQHVMESQRSHPDARGQFTSLLTQIGVAGKIVAAQVRRAGLIEIWGTTGDVNVQGERVQKLDRIAQDTFVDVLGRSGCVAAMASEEEHQIIEVASEDAGGYCVAFDPLDGSSNIDVNVSIGTIFGVYRRNNPTEVVRRDFLRPGNEQVAAGYIIYGSSTALVLAMGNSVDLFTLDPSAGEFFLTMRGLKFPEKTKLLSINECNEPYWAAWVKPYVESVKSRNDAERRRVSSRHIGSLVADFHRNLIQGGIYLYPLNAYTGKGKLRVLYECAPLAFVAERAGGAAISEQGRVLDLQAGDLHQRCGFVIGSAAEVAVVEKFMSEYGLLPPASP